MVQPDTNTPGGAVVALALSDGTTITTGAANNSPVWVDFGAVSDITYAIWGGTGSTAGGSIFMVELDGHILLMMSLTVRFGVII